MIIERFTHPARAALVSAQRAAWKLHSGHIDTEHMLLGLLVQPNGTATRVLGAAGIHREPVMVEIEGRLWRDRPDPQPENTVAVADRPWWLPRRRRHHDRASDHHIPFTQGVKDALELTFREALHLEQHYIGTGHLLLGLVREDRGMAAAILRDAGLELETLRAQVLANPELAPWRG